VDLSAPVYVGGSTGAFRIGFSMLKMEQKAAELRNQIVAVCADAGHSAPPFLLV